MATGAAIKTSHSIVLDAGPIIKGEPSVSSLLLQCEQIVTTPAVISEIRDQATRHRLETTLLPFLVQKTPKVESIKVISDFARKTGDIAVLSLTDIQLLALTYDIECERNAGDWRLRKAPGQKRTNGPPPPKEESTSTNDEKDGIQPSQIQAESLCSSTPQLDMSTAPVEISHTEFSREQPSLLELCSQDQPAGVPTSSNISSTESSAVKTEEYNMENLTESLRDTALQADDEEARHLSERTDGSDSEGWITPSNIKRKQLEENKADASRTSEPKMVQVAMITTDFAMQNVLLQMNLNLLSPTLQRVKHVKTFILRCHACFNLVRDMSKQFCPRCGRPTLTRVTCTTDQNGEFKLHFKKNFQWNNRGNKFSIPKPVHGASNQRVKGGGKGGWGNHLILSEDQKEYTRAMAQEKRQKIRDLMDEDFLPSILSGDRSKQMGRPHVGAGRNVNSKKR